MIFLVKKLPRYVFFEEVDGIDDDGSKNHLRESKGFDANLDRIYFIMDDEVNILRIQRLLEHCIENI